MSTARKSDLIATLLGMDPFNELALRLSLALTTWRYANALAHHRPDAFSVFAQAFASGSAFRFHVGRNHLHVCMGKAEK
ncbi:hypothetical protein [Paraburkholderia sacchari]|uniref:hypothetical protein n=1 Tax=Paraburkholderia sacchari TaxID=159450 RepID=UPI003D99545B